MNNTTHNLDIYFFPGGHQSNPYIRLLGNALGSATDDVSVFFEAINHLDAACLKRKPGRKKIIHLHWVPEIYPRMIRGRFIYNILSTFVYLKIFSQLILIAAMKILRSAKVVWTVHNVNYYHLRPTITALLTACFSALADAYIFHCEAARNDFLRHASPNAKKPVFIIPHGNFTGIYGPMEKNQSEARAKLNLPLDAVIFLVAGVMRQSKQLEWLFSKLTALPQQNIRFFAAGEPLTPREQKLFEKYRRDERFIFLPQFVPDEKMPLLFAAADFLISAQTRGYVSGIAVAALSYGLPAIVFDWGCASLHVKHGVNGFLFRDEATLLNAIAESINKIKKPHEYSAMRDSAIESMKQFELYNTGKATVAAYETVLYGNASSP